MGRELRGRRKEWRVTTLTLYHAPSVCLYIVLHYMYVCAQNMLFFLQEPPVKNPKLGELTDRVHAQSFVQSYSVFSSYSASRFTSSSSSLSSSPPRPREGSRFRTDMLVYHRFSVCTTVETRLMDTLQQRTPMIKLTISESPDSPSVHFNT